MNGHDGRKMRELVLMGEAGSGKSTTFNAICDGREISPHGVGLRTTGCRISAQSIPADVEEEYAELIWKTDDELMLTMYDIVSDNLVDDWRGRSFFPETRPEKLPSLSDERVRALAKKAIHAEWKKYRPDAERYGRDDAGRLDCLLIATLILRFYGTLKLAELRRKTIVAPDDVKSLAVFPRDWFFRWQSGGEGTFWSLRKVAFAFLSKAVCHVHSPTLERLGCVITDCPGLFAGPWDTAVARKAMLKADAILYLIGGQKQMTESDMRVLSEIRKTQQAHKLFFAINARLSKETAENELRPVDFYRLKNAGFPIEREEDICVFNAALAFNAKTTPSNPAAWGKAVRALLAQYLDLDPFDENDIARVRELQQNPDKLYRASGLEAVLDAALDGMSAVACVPGRHLEIALVGEYQNGKSTIFNAMLGGRDLSPRGVNVKRSACTITACALSRDREEYAEFEWRSEAMLDEVVAIGGASDGVGGEDVPRLAKLISRFRNSSELARLRKRREMPIKEARDLLVYPVDWEPRWQQDGSGGGFEFAQIAWVFIERVKYHVHSKVLDRLDCDLTDSPGFGDGEWDEALARAAILRADVLVCVLDRKKSMSSNSPYFRRLSWIRQIKKDNGVLYALNAEASRENAEEWRKTNVSTIRQNGYGVEEWQMPVFNAELGRHVAKMRSANGDVSLKIVRPTLIKWLNLDQYSNDDCARMNDLCANPRRMSRESGFDDFICAVQRAASDFRTKERDGRLNVSPILIQEDGAPALENGFAWNDDSSFVSRLMKGCRWKAGIPHDTCPHVVSDEKERVWCPAPGYAWVDNRTNETCWRKGVEWKPGRRHPAWPHVVSGRKEGKWHPEPGYGYLNGGRDDLRVKWKPRLKHPDCPNVVSSETPDTWDPLPGYAWVDETSWMTKWQKGVKWTAGLSHPDCPNVVSSTKANEWNPLPGYAWVDETSWTTKLKGGVNWMAGLKHPDVPHIPYVYASHTEGVWRTYPGYVFAVSGCYESRNPYNTVKWQPGYKRSDGKVAGNVEGHWVNPILYFLLTH